MSLPTTAVYGGMLGLLFLMLSLNVIRIRRAVGANLGHDGNPRLQRAVRGHANFSEYVPLVLLLMGIAELSDTPVWRLHVLGGTLLLGRLLHAYCFALTEGHFPSRFGGMALTFAALVIGVVEAFRSAF